MFHLYAQDETDGVYDIRLAGAVGADDRSERAERSDAHGAVIKFEVVPFEQMDATTSLCHDGRLWLKAAT